MSLFRFSNIVHNTPFLLGTAIAVFVLAEQGCAAGTASNETTGNTNSANTTVGAGGSLSTSSAGGAETTGKGGSTASTGAPLPCGIDCSSIQTDDCHEAVCNESTKQCEVVNASNGTSCEDGLFCTVNDTCVEGICEGGGANDCGLSGGDCDDISCDETNKSCGTMPKTNGALCTNSQDLCLVNTTCQNGLCTGITKDCFFQPVPNDCYSSVCNPMSGQCEPQVDPTKEGANCNDPMDLCTVNKTCSSGTCTGGIPKDCSALTMGCNLGQCDAMTGVCVATPVMPGQQCDDLNFCTTGETCQNGQCTGGTPITQCSGQTEDKCCPSGCTESNDKDCGGTIPNFMGEKGPVLAGWKQCAGYLDVVGGDDVPLAWGGPCTGTQYNKILVACGDTINTYRYLEVSKNVFKDLLSSYPEQGLIVAAKDQNGMSFPIDNKIYAQGNNPNTARSWWNGGSGCGENNTNITINNSCSWEASNCFGQNISGPRYLWVYVAP